MSWLTCDATAGFRSSSREVDIDDFSMWPADKRADITDGDSRLGMLGICGDGSAKFTSEADANKAAGR